MKKTDKKAPLAAIILVAALFISLVGGLGGGLASLTAAPPAQGMANAPTSTTLYSFRSAELLESHYQKHGGEFGNITKEEYLLLANQLIASSTALRKQEKEDGDTVMYEEESNRFLVLSTDGYIRTFFRPDDGLAYYERQ